MKKLLFSLFTVFSVSFIAAQSYYTEDFESSSLPEGWTAEVDGPGSWEFGGTTVPGGVVNDNYVYPFDSKAAIYDDDANGSGASPSVATLTSPTFEDFTFEEGVKLSFEYACNFYPMNNGGRFYVEIFDGTDWVEILNATSMVQPTVFELDVWEYIDENPDFQVRFVFDDLGNWSWGAGVNYFYLQEVMGVQDVNKNAFSIYPNPVKDVLKIKVNQRINQLSLYDLTGKQLVVKSNVEELDMSNLSSGVYVLKAVMQDGSVITQKVVKK